MISSKIQVVGHRGAAGYAPENTFASFDKALSMGVDAIEFDVLLTKDQVPVVFHDRTLERMTDGSGKLVEKTFAELSALTVKGGGKIPTLQDVLARYATKVHLFIEVKEPAAAIPTAKMCAALSDAKPFCLISFKEAALRDIRTHFPEFSIGLNWERTPWPEAKPLIESLAPDYFNPAQELLDEACVRYTRTRNMKIGVWTVNEPNDIVLVKSLGVDAIISDYPDRLR
ncbi:MAG: glycerophosphodiester phosphodiesterase [Proteobacteria bacterium]|nr:glycerophosphodiester phosphodiesterase [Pseudomonadota bacterium]